MAEHDQEKCPEWLPEWLPEWGEVERKLSEQELSCEPDLEVKETKLKTRKWVGWVEQNVETRQEAWWLMEEIADGVEVVGDVVAKGVDYVFGGSEVVAAEIKDGFHSPNVKPMSEELFLKLMPKKYDIIYEALNKSNKLLSRKWMQEAVMQKIEWRKLKRIWIWLLQFYQWIELAQEYIRLKWSVPEDFPVITWIWDTWLLIEEKLPTAKWHFMEIWWKYDDKWQSIAEAWMQGLKSWTKEAVKWLKELNKKLEGYQKDVKK